MIEVVAANAHTMATLIFPIASVRGAEYVADRQAIHEGKQA